MTADSLGTWKNPPLAYVVAELVISPHYNLANVIPNLQDLLRESYPRTQEAQELVIESNKATSQPVWRLMSADQKRAVQFGQRVIALHSTSYAHSTEFLGRWADVLEATEKAKLNPFVERAGLRLIDLVVPTGENAPENYLRSEIQGVKPEGAMTMGAMWAAGFDIKGCTVNLRTAAPTPRGLLFPPDFSPIQLAKPKILLEAEENLFKSKSIGFIDTDCMKNIQKVFNASELLSTYKEMQKLASLTFKTAMSELARDEWM